MYKEITEIDFCSVIATTLSARSNKLFDFGEFVHECFAQLCVKGDIKLNQIKTRNFIPNDNFPRSLPENEVSIINAELEEFRIETKSVFIDMMIQNVGKILVI